MMYTNKQYEDEDFFYLVTQDLLLNAQEAKTSQEDALTEVYMFPLV